MVWKFFGSSQRSFLEGGFKGVGLAIGEKWGTNERSFCRSLVENKSSNLRKFASTFIQLCLACTPVFFSESFW